MPTARPDDLALTVLLLCQDAPSPEREGRAMEFGAQDKAGVLHPGVPEGERAVRFALRIVARPATTAAGTGRRAVGDLPAPGNGGYRFHWL